MSDHGTVLVVDDTLESLRLVTGVLTAEGYTVHPADSGELALASATAHPPDLILLDVRMPGMDGFEVCRRLKAAEATRSIPVIFLSVATEVGERVEGLRLGAVDYITKPFEPLELLARVRTRLELSRLQSKLEQLVAERTAELKKVNRELFETGQRFQSLFDHAPVAVWEEDLAEVKAEFDRLRASGVKDWRAYFAEHPETLVKFAGSVRILEINRESLNVFGVGSKDEISRHLPDYFKEDSWPVFCEEMIALAEGRTSFESEIPVRDLKGAARLFYLRLSVEPGCEATLGRVLVSFLDVTELRLAERRYRAVIKNCIDGFFINDAKARFIEVNEAFCRMIGYSQDELLKMSVQDVEALEKPSDTTAHIEKVVRSGGDRFESRHRRKDDRIIDVEVSSNYLMDHDLFFVFIRDITARKRMEEELRQSSKMRAIGQLAGGLAHDLNNQLAPVMGYAEMLLEEMTDPRAREYVAEIIKCTERAANLTRDMLAYARRGKYRSAAIDVHKLIDEAVALLSHSLDKRIVIRKELKANPAMVEGDPTLLENALMHLAIHARDSMPDGGTLTFETDSVEVDDTYRQKFAVEVPVGAYIRIVVRDTGRGIPRELLANIFEPFAGGLPPARGANGLELASVHGAVKAHQGDIAVSSDLGKGSAFCLLLPTARAGTTRVGNESARVLVVDDEESMRLMVESLLRSLGHSATLCGDGVEAVAFYRENWRNVDLVILDVTLPKLSGRDTFLQMREINPDVRALILSGYGMDDAARGILDSGAQGFLQKPFRGAEFSSKVAAILHGT